MDYPFFTDGGNRNPYRSLGHVSICPNRQQILGESNGTRCVTSVVGGDHKLVSSCFVYFLFLLFAFKAKKCQTHCQFLPFFGFESSKLLTATASAPQWSLLHSSGCRCQSPNTSMVQSCPFRSEHVRTFLLDPRFVREKNICAFGGLPEFVIGQIPANS